MTSLFLLAYLGGVAWLAYKAAKAAWREAGEHIAANTRRGVYSGRPADVRANRAARQRRRRARARMRAAGASESDIYAAIPEHMS